MLQTHPPLTKALREMRDSLRADTLLSSDLLESSVLFLFFFKLETEGGREGGREVQDCA